MSSHLPPPSPSHILRSHSSPINALHIPENNERIYSGDATGTITVTSTRTLRPITKWKAHKEGILGVEEWDSVIITHARDNKIHVWNRIEEPPASMRIGSTAALVDLPVPSLRYSLDVNALNFCRFSLLRVSTTAQGLIAVPNLVESGAADIWALHECDRIHAAIGQELIKAEDPKSEYRGRGTFGIVMSMHLYLSEAEGFSDNALPTTNLRLLCAYENGSVILWKYTRKERVKSVEGAGWEKVWNVKLHAESIMAMRVSKTNSFALTVSADHLIGRYDLKDESADPEKSCRIFRTQYPGNGSIAIHDEERVCAIGGWDGDIRLYSTKSFKPLGTLQYYKVACQTVEFARAQWVNTSGEDDEDEEDEKERIKQSRWLVSGGKDHRAIIWELMDFNKKRKEGVH